MKSEVQQLLHRVPIALFTVHCSLFTLLCSGCVSARSYIVIRPVVDLRTQPSSAAPSGHDPMEETQLLYGEQVRVRERHDGWARVEALEQPEHSHENRWQGYPGWLPEAALAEPLWDAAPPNLVVTDKWVRASEDAYGLQPSPWQFALGTYLHGEDFGNALWRVELHDGAFVWIRRDAAQLLETQAKLTGAQQRAAILRAAHELLGDAYYWGGRSPRAEAAAGLITGVDCSALVNLAYRTVGVTVPRDAHEQFQRARPVPQPQPADVVFLSEQDNPAKIVHVLLYAGDDMLLESPGTGLGVRRILAKERFGRSLAELPSGSVIGSQTVTYGTFLTE